MGNNYLETSGFHLGLGGPADFTGQKYENEELQSAQTTFWTATNPDDTGGNAPTGPGSPTTAPKTNWTNTNADFEEDYERDSENVDEGEAIWFNDNWRRIDTISRYKIEATLEDGTKIEGPGNLITDNSGRNYLVFLDRVVRDLNDATSRLKSIEFVQNIDYDHRYWQGNFSNEFNFGITCFTVGTVIAAANGPRKVEDLKVGEAVKTRDHGDQPIRWIGMAGVGDGLQLQPSLQPVIISRGALGPNVPAADLRVSQQHRMLLSSPIVKRMFDVDEVMVAAKHLTGIPGIKIDESARQECYFHILFDQHEVIFANGAPTESLYLGQEAKNSLSPDGAAEIEKLFPELFSDSFSGKFTPARPFISARRCKKAVARHLRNHKELVSDCFSGKNTLTE